METVVVNFTPEQVAIANRIAEIRHGYVVEKDLKGDDCTYSRDPSLVRQLMGARGELALALITGLVWTGQISGTENIPKKDRPTDVGSLEVRTRRLASQSMLVKKPETLSKVFVLAVPAVEGDDASTTDKIRLVGWEHGTNGTWNPNIPDPATEICQSELRPMRELPIDEWNPGELHIHVYGHVYHYPPGEKNWYAEEWSHPHAYTPKNRG